MSKADAATPQREPRGKWARLYPVYAKLIGKGFTREGAVDWLIREKEIHARDKQQALNAFIQKHHRETTTSTQATNP